MSAFDWAQAIPDAARPAANTIPSASAAEPVAGGYNWSQAALAQNAKPNPAMYRTMIKTAQSAPLQGSTSGPFNRMAIGFGHGVMDVVHGVEQLGLNALNPLPFLAAHSGGALKIAPQAKQGLIPRALASVNQSAAEGNAAFQPLASKYPFTAGTGNIAGNLAVTAPLMFVGGEAADALLPEAGGGVIGGLSREAAKNAISGAIGSGAQYVAPGSGASHLTNALEGGALSAGLPLALRPVGKLFSAGVSGISKIGSRIRPSVNPEIQAAAKSFGITPSVGEMSGSVPYQKLETALEHVPFSGMGKVRATNAQQFKTAAQNLLNQYDVGAQDPNQLIREGAQKILNENRATAGKLYDKVAAMAARPRTGVASPLLPGEAPNTVNMASTQDAAKNIINQFSGNQDLNAEPGFLKDVQPYTQAQPRTYEAARKLRSQLGQLQASAGFGTPESLAYGNLRTALEKDMDNYALSHGTDLSNAYKAAQDFYKQNVVPFKAIAPLKSLVSGKMDTDTILGSFVKNNRPELAGKLMSKLPPDAQNAVRWNVLQKGFNKANLSGTREGAPTDPRQFASYWENLGSTKDALFEPQDRALIDGYAKLARAMPRAATYSEFVHRPTGVKTAVLGSGVAEGAALITHPHLAVPGIFGVMGLRRMLTEPWGQKILLRASTTTNPSSLSSLLKLAGKRLGAGVSVASPYAAPQILNQMHPSSTVLPQMQQ